MEEREVSVIFSVPSSMYTQLFLVLSSAPLTEYTERMTLVKNVYEDMGKGCGVGGGDSDNSYIRTIQDQYSYSMQRKRKLKDNTYLCLYKHEQSKLTLYMSIRESLSIEHDIDLNDYKVGAYHQTIRDYVYCRENGIRIALERRYNDYIDPNVEQMDYDCFNRYKFDCLVHIEYEFAKDTCVDDVLQQFQQNVCRDEIIYRLLFIVSIKNLNFISDEIINIKNMSLVHKYTHINIQNVEKKKMEYFSLKYDGIRKNFCIFNKYLQLDGNCFEFENHWFGQVIIGHCEIVNDMIYIIDIYLISENFNKIAKKYNISYTGALQNYHHFYNSNTAANATTASNKKDGNLKTQDEYFHMKRMCNNIKYMQPIDAINAINLLANIWKHEPSVACSIKLQKFCTSLAKLQKRERRCKLKIDGFLGFAGNKIYKIKNESTIDLLLKFDAMFKAVITKMKTGNQELKKMVKFVNIQKMVNLVEFENKYPGKFGRFVGDYLYFAGDECFTKHFHGWKILIDMKLMEEQMALMHSTLFILLLEFCVDASEKRLVFTRIRCDKFSANSSKVLVKIIQQS